jgi:hypothetical protein
MGICRWTYIQKIKTNTMKKFFEKELIIIAIISWLLYSVIKKVVFYLYSYEIVIKNFSSAIIDLAIWIITYLSVYKIFYIYKKRKLLEFVLLFFFYKL